MNKNTKEKLPKLIFTNAKTFYSNSVEFYSEQVRKSVPTMKDGFRVLGNTNEFQSETAFVSINDLKLVAGSSTPVYSSASEINNINIMISFTGENHTNIDGKNYHWYQNAYAILMPPSVRAGRCSLRSAMTFNVIPEIFLKKAKIMLGEENIRMEDFRFHEPRLIPLVYGDIQFEMMLRQLCLYTDQLLAASSQTLETLGVDEQFYRLAIMMLLPEKFFEYTMTKQVYLSDSATSMRVLDDYVNASNHIFKNVAELESFTGLPTRTMQLAFRKYFNMTPTQWLRNIALKYARTLIIQHKGINVTQIALECGFTNFSLFAKYYREQFGELPSETLKKRAKK